MMRGGRELLQQYNDRKFFQNNEKQTSQQQQICDERKDKRNYHFHIDI